MPPTPPPGPRAAPPGLRERGATWPRRRGGTAGPDIRNPCSRGSPRAGTPRRGNSAPPPAGRASVPPAPSLAPGPPGITACTGSCSPQTWFRGRCVVLGRHREGEGGCWMHPSGRDGSAGTPRPLACRRRRRQPSQVTKSNLEPGTINEDFCRPWRLVLPGTKINARNRNLIT